MSQAITKVKALELRHRNPERSAAAPPALQLHIPITPHEPSGQVAQSPFASLSGYQPITLDEHDNQLNSSSSTIMQHQSHVSATLDTLHIPGAGTSGHLKPSSNEHKGDAPTNREQAPKKPRQQRTCQKCGIPNCEGSATRKYCKNPCQDCGKTECHGRNSQHPRKACTVGWDFHHKKLK